MDMYDGLRQCAKELALVPLIGYAVCVSSSDAYASTKYARLGHPKLGYTAFYKLPDFSHVELAQKEHGQRELNAVGRIQRTARYEDIIGAVERRYELPKGLLFGLVMNESYGDPLQPNSGGDGGLGLVHIQPRTAKAYGLHVVSGGSNGWVDRESARKIREIIESCHWSLSCVAKYDDRAHLIINLDVTARLLKDGYVRKGTWWGAVQTINPGEQGYAAKIYRYKGDAVRYRSAAERDFNQKNRGKKIVSHPMTFQRYLRAFWRVNNNWGLKNYISNSRKVPGKSEKKKSRRNG